MEKNEIPYDKETLEALFDGEKKLIVPQYQRGYSWTEVQLEQFLSDIDEFKENKEYYFGHFILEETKNYLEFIDGQQRITTFILFLIVCRLHSENTVIDFNRYIDKFQTIDYDQELLNILKNNLNEIIKGQKKLIAYNDLENENDTISSQKIKFALNYFNEAFVSEKSKIKLKKEEIEKYINVFINSHISTHITYNKAVAVQIFELQNTRGVKLTLFEKVKSKLMRVIFLNSDLSNQEKLINEVQNSFANIYAIEEKTKSNSLCGKVTLEEVLLHHLRIVDDGSKLTSKGDKQKFLYPKKEGNREENILNYINDQLKSKQKDVIDYILKLSFYLEKSILFLYSNSTIVNNYFTLKYYDNQIPLVGDNLLLDRQLSLEFYLLLFHSKKEIHICNETILLLWERLLFSRDFHNKYHNKRYRDDFQLLFFEILKEDDIEKQLRHYVQDGFILETKNLPEIVKHYISDNKKNILCNAFFWWTEKMVYILYKYEIFISANFHDLRIIMNTGKSIEHILPQEWKWEWINEPKALEISEDGKKKNEEIRKIINGIGNLLLISGPENSRLNNDHPKDKIYEKLGSSGSYKIHNEEREKWNDFSKWEDIINERGNEIYKFLIEFLEKKI